MRNQKFHQAKPRQGRNFQRRFTYDANSQKKVLEAIQMVQSLPKVTNQVASEVYVPVHKFTDFGFSPELQKNIASKNYTIPTPIQDQAISQIMEGRDVIGLANTGTGKTAAFLLPLVDKVVKNSMERVFIIAPTRELATQIYDELRAFTKGVSRYAVLCVGGTSIHRQKADLKQNPHFVIGTPGRIKDLIEERSLYLSQFANVVLDEADRMVDIGFINDIKYFISLLPKKRQSLFFSATISRKEEEILKNFVNNPITVSVKQQETAGSITQDIIKLEPGYNKVDKLHDLLAQDGFDKVLIFGRTKWGIQKLTDELIKRGFKAGAIHGNKRQNQRQRTLDQFKRDEIKILLATDVASRGIDIQNVSHVINYDLPATIEDYVHRIGRTGRANKTGVALTFVE